MSFGASVGFWCHLIEFWGLNGVLGSPCCLLGSQWGFWGHPVDFWGLSGVFGVTMMSFGVSMGFCCHLVEFRGLAEVSLSRCRILGSPGPRMTPKMRPYCLGVSFWGWF